MGKMFSTKEVITIVVSFIVALLVNVYWANIIAIKANKVFIGSPHAYEYEDKNGNNYKKSTHEDSFRIIDKPLPWSLENSSYLRLAVYNTNVRSLKNATLHVYFPDGLIVELIKDEKNKFPWQITLPNKEYACIFNNESINNGLILKPYPFKIKFPKVDEYKIGFAITAEDMPFKKDNFIINVY